MPEFYRLDMPKEEIDETLLSFSNENLIDNWYFVGGGIAGKLPINQKGITIAQSNGFVIDRWRCTEPGFAVDPDGVTIPAGAYFIQKQEFAQFDGRTMTMSLLISDGTLLSGTGTIRMGTVTNFYWESGIRLYLDFLAAGTAVIGINVDFKRKILAAKLEIGIRQTLTRKKPGGQHEIASVPDYGTELAKCQRYSFSAKTNAPYAQIGGGTAFSDRIVLINIVLPVPMRANPVISYNGKFQIVGGPARDVVNMSVVSWNGSNLIGINATPSENVSPGDAYILRSNNDATARLFLSAEL